MSVRKVPASRPALSVLALLSLVLPLPAAASAAEDAEDQAGIVVTGERGHDDIMATKTGTALLDTPQSVVTLDRDRLDDQGVASLGEALRYVPGITIGQGEGHRDQVILRGQPSTADFFLDGLRDDAQYYRPLYNTQQVEVLKGANVLLFGRGGGGGAINRISKLAQLGTARTAASGGLDSFGGWSLAGDVNLPLGHAAAVRINGTYEELATNRDQFGGHFAGIAPSVTLRAGADTTLVLAYEYDRDDRVVDRGVPALGARPMAGYAGTLFGSPAVNRGTLDAQIARLRLNQRLGDGLTLAVTGQYAFYDKHYANILPDLASAAAVRFSGYDAASRRGNWIGQADLVWHGATGGIGHTVLAGIELSSQVSDTARRNALFAVPGASGSGAATITLPLAGSFAFPAISWTAPVTDSHSAVRTHAFYLQDQIGVTPWLQLVAGVRLDHFAITATNRLTQLRSQRSDRQWSPRLGVVLKPRPGLSLYASLARSFLPQSGDQFSALDPSFQTLAPESFRNLELGAKWEPAPGLSLTLAGFRLDRTNTRVADPAQPGFWLLTGASRVKGIELALAGRIAPNWQLSLGYTRQTGTVRSATAAAPAGRRLEKLPRDQASAWTRYDISPRFGLGLGMVHQSGQYATISNAVWLPGFTRLDAAAYITVSERIGLQLNVENLTDTAYFASAHTDNNIQPGEPIHAQLTVRLAF